MEPIIDTTGYFADEIGLAWIGNDQRHYDPMDEDTNLDGWDEYDDAGDALIDEDDRFDLTGDRFPFE